MQFHKCFCLLLILYCIFWKIDKSVSYYMYIRVFMQVPLPPNFIFENCKVEFLEHLHISEKFLSRRKTVNNQSIKGLLKVILERSISKLLRES
jgi:hypothetical protein